MNRCEQIEKLLWDYPDLKASDSGKLLAHIENCPRCKAALAGIEAIRESRKADRSLISKIDPEVFDNAVLGKVRAQRSFPESKSEGRQFIFRTVSSIGLAAAIVIFMIMSISDLGNLPAFKPVDRGSSPDSGEAYNILEIRLRSDDLFEAPAAYSDIEPRKKSSPKAPFSILEKPITSPSPDSVNIGAVYLSDETVPMMSQQMRASISEVLIDTGMIQQANIPQAILVTVEKMPRAINIVAPEYPAWGRKRGLSCVVWVKARVDRNGMVTDVEIISSSVSAAGFEDAALDAAKKSSYLPAESNGIRIPVWIMYPVKFIYSK
ncbi:MAG: TonB family protein [candidate division Zixibacteria bacterium]